MSNLEEHEREQARITAECMAGTCDHPECHEDEDADQPPLMKEVMEAISPSVLGCIDTNEQRGVRVLRVLLDQYGDGGDDIETMLGDMLVDVRHLCDLARIAFSEADRRGQAHYAAELFENDGPANHDELYAAMLREDRVLEEEDA
jgi:hypothetical protein